jgi:hypothetical protein
MAAGRELAVSVEERTFRAVVRPSAPHQDDLELPHVELLSAVAATRDANGVPGRHWNLAEVRSAMITVFFPAVLAR